MRIALFFPLLLAACGAPGTEDVGGVTPGEAQALNEAAAMLDANAVEPVLVAPSAQKQDGAD